MKWGIHISDMQREFIHLLQAYLPRIIGALVLLLLGWLISRLLQLIAFRIVNRINRLGVLKTEARDPGIQKSTPRIVALVVFWGSFLLFIASAVQVLGLPVVTSGLSRLAAYLPNVLAAVLVVVAGLVLGNIVKVAVNKTVLSAGISTSRFIGESARISVLVIASLIALGQVGIDSTVLVMAFSLVVGGIIGGMALAFGFGARTAVSNLIAMRNVGRNYRDGMLIKIGNIQGRIIKISHGVVIIHTSEGRAQVPAKLFEEEAAVLLDEKE